MINNIILSSIIFFKNGKHQNVIIIFVKKDKQPSIEENGSFGFICERGMDSEELVLEIPYKQKIRRFFSRPTIIFIVICMLSIVAYVLSLFGLPIALLG